MTGLKMKYFVLKPRSNYANDRYGAASRKAMRAYANHIFIEDEDLARDLLVWAAEESAWAKHLNISEEK